MNHRFLSVLSLSLLSFSLALPASASTTLTAAVSPSAKEAFEAAVTVYQKIHSDITVTGVFAGSKDIASQVSKGSGIDVVILGTPKVAALSIFIDTPEVLFREHTAIAVSKQASDKVKTAQDLSKSGIRVGAGTKGSFIAEVQQSVLDKLSAQYGKDFLPKYETNATSSRTDSGKLMQLVASNGIDATIIFASEIDTKSANEITLPSSAKTEVSYSVAQVKSSGHGSEAKAFITWLLCPESQAIFKAHHHDGR